MSETPHGRRNIQTARRAKHGSSFQSFAVLLGKRTPHYKRQIDNRRKEQTKMPRSWTWTDETEISEEEMEKRTPLLNSLAQQWSALHDAEEQRGFIRRARMDDFDDGPEPEDEADAYRMQQLDRLRSAQHAAQVQAIEDAIAAQGARMMRPYEHWNEDESYMRYMECDRFGDYCD
jgi:hypothetical protein